MLRANPHLIEINIRLWLNALRKKYSADLTLSAIPEDEWLELKHFGFDMVWLMGVWMPSPESGKIAKSDAKLLDEAKKIRPGAGIENIGPSPYAVFDYRLNPEFGFEGEIKALKEKLNSLGMKLLLDFVSNHTARDNPFIKECEGCFIKGTLQDYENHPDWFFETEIKGRKEYVAYGRDPNFPPWTDTAQINYFNPYTREKMRDMLMRLAEMCDGARCDMVMLTLNDIHENTWGWLLNKTGYPRPDEEFWSGAIKKVKEKFPEFVFIAEVYWGLEWRLQQIGFDYTYDKVTYDRLRYMGAEDVRGHLRAEKLYQKRSVRFIDNHDEIPSISAFGKEKAMAAAVIVSTIKGLRYFYEMQLKGVRRKIPIQLLDAELETDISVKKFYEKLLKIVDHPAFHGGEWNLLEVSRLYHNDETHRNILSWFWSQRRTLKIVAVNYSGSVSSGKINFSVKASGDSAVIFEELSDRFFSFKVQDIQDGIPMDKIPPYSAYIFDIEF
ncbi:MAG: glycosidase [Elusimicrobia bacterium]|nr:glycosidase [Elusimicrobiota bacterium]